MNEELLDQLAETPARLQALLAQLNSGAWDYQAPDAQATDPWTMAHLIRHLRDIEVDAFQFRIKQILTQGDPFWEARFGGHLSPDRPLDGPSALDAFIQARQETVERLRRLTPEQWAMTALHPKRGPLDLTFFAQAFLAHDQEHLKQAEALLAAIPPGTAG